MTSTVSTRDRPGRRRGREYVRGPSAALQPYVESRGTSVDAHPGNVFHHNTNVPPAT
jgi:hypothetical protein